MKKYSKHTLGLISLALLLLMMSCELDNYEAPGAHLYGSLVDAATKDPVPSQTLNGALIKLTQLNYSSNTANPINTTVHQDGSYDNANIFPGTYKITAEGPFYYNDEITVDVSGSTKQDIEVVPYLNVEATIGEVTSTSIALTFTVKTNNNTQKIARVAGMIGVTQGVDINNYLNESSDYLALTNAESVPNETVEATIYSATFTGLQPNTEYYIRAGGRTTTTENPSAYYNYTNVIKVKTGN